MSENTIKAAEEAALKAANAFADSQFHPSEVTNESYPIQQWKRIQQSFLAGWNAKPSGYSEEEVRNLMLWAALNEPSEQLISEHLASVKPSVEQPTMTNEEFQSRVKEVFTGFFNTHTEWLAHHYGSSGKTSDSTTAIRSLSIPPAATPVQPSGSVSIEQYQMILDLFKISVNDLCNSKYLVYRNGGIDEKEAKSLVENDTTLITMKGEISNAESILNANNTNI